MRILTLNLLATINIQIVSSNILHKGRAAKVYFENNLLFFKAKTQGDPELAVITWLSQAYLDWPQMNMDWPQITVTDLKRQDWRQPHAQNSKQC